MAASAMRSRSVRVRFGLTASRLSRRDASARTVSWNTMAALPRSWFVVAWAESSSPPSVMVPVSGVLNPARVLMRVVLPAPEPPITTVTVPGARSRFTSASPTVPSGWVSFRFRARRCGASDMGGEGLIGVVSTMARTSWRLRLIATTPATVPATVVTCSRTRSSTMIKVAAVIASITPESRASHAVKPKPSSTACSTRLNRNSPGICHSRSFSTRPRVFPMASLTNRFPRDRLRAVRSDGWAQANSKSRSSSSSVAVV